jgi:D-glycero-D-manno-heptose 1,7-bisphosphate phosphatase
MTPPIGIYAQFFNTVDYSGNPAIFIDRDGVLVEEVNYLCRKEDVAFIPGAIEAIAKFNRAGIPVVMISNQAGIGRGYFGWKDFEEVQKTVMNGLAQAGAFLDAVLACPFHEDGINEYRVGEHPFRKPNPGMILFAAGKMGICLNKSWMVGDKVCDIEAAGKAGLCGAVHVETGHGKEERIKIHALELKTFKLLCTASLASVSDVLLKQFENNVVCNG